MTLTATVAHSRIQRQILEAEELSDRLLQSKSKLLTELTSARLELDLESRAIGQDAIVRLQKSINSQVTSMNDLLRVHGLLNDVAKVTDGVDHDDKPRHPLVEAKSEAA